MTALRRLLWCSIVLVSCSGDDDAAPVESVAPLATTPVIAVPTQVDDIIEAFGVERELAECLNLELGDVANIDPTELTPELLSRPVCGTSLLAILSGVPTGG